MPDHNWVQSERAARDRARIYETICAHIDESGRSPNRVQLAAELGLAEITVRRHVNKLVAEGRLTKIGHQLRPTRT